MPGRRASRAHGVTRKTSSRPEMSVPPLPSYFTSVLDVPLHITCVCDIHSSNFIFVPPENCYQQAEKTEKNIHAASLPRNCGEDKYQGLERLRLRSLTHGAHLS